MNPAVRNVLSSAVAVAVAALVAWGGAQDSAEVGGLSVFVLGVIVAFAVQWIVFVPSYLARTERFFDLTGSITYMTVTIVALAASDDLDARAWIAAAFVIVWAGRLGQFLFRRILRDGFDGRFDTIKTSPSTFFMTWTIQGLWVSLTMACALAIITSADREDLGVIGFLGIAIWALGFVVEVVSDSQKSAWRERPENQGRFITVGLWGVSRHPNYVGEITLWAGIAVLALPVLDGWRLVCLVSPLFVYVLLRFISGVPLLERRAEKKWGEEPEFRAYVDKVPVLFPFGPGGQIASARRRSGSGSSPSA